MTARRPRLEPRNKPVQKRSQEAVDAVARLLEASPAIARPNADRAAYLVVEAVESLTHRWAAHPEYQTMEEDAFVEEVVDLLEGYLTLASGRPRRARRSTPARPRPR